jgi:lysylphosphatidylglycerol synthetase-like protein (DUF2156 family)
MNRNDEPLRQELRRYAGQVAATHTPPPAAGIWLMAERRRRRLAVERAALPLRIMQMVSLVCLLAGTAWMLAHSGLLRDVEAMSAATAAITCAAVLLVVAGCWAMLAAGRRVSE